MDSTKESIGEYVNAEHIVQKRRKPNLLAVKRVKCVKKQSPATTSDLIPLGGDVFIRIRKQGSSACVNIRHYKRDMYGKMSSNKRGMTLSMEEWSQLKKVSKDVDKKIKERETNEFIASELLRLQLDMQGAQIDDIKKTFDVSA